MEYGIRASDRVFAELRDDIVSGRLPPGSEHSIYEFADRFGLSRTPVREAVLRLAELGMVESLRNRGLRVRGLSVDEVRSIFEFRLLIEVPAAEHAAAKADPALSLVLRAALGRMRMATEVDDVPAFEDADRHLHAVIVDALGNPRVSAAVTSLRDATQAMGATTMNRQRRLAEVEVEHEPIVDAIAAGDRERAASAMRKHLLRTQDLLAATLGT